MEENPPASAAGGAGSGARWPRPLRYTHATILRAREVFWTRETVVEVHFAFERRWFGDNGGHI